MSQTPRFRTLSREDYPDAPAWFDTFLTLYNETTGGLVDALSGGLDDTNIRKQFEARSITTAATLEATFAGGAVSFKNRIDVAPRKVTLAKCNPPSGTSFSGRTWTTFALQGAWVAYNSEHIPQYMIDGNGIVHLRGIVKSGTLGTLACTLPVGFRPEYDSNFAVSSNAAFGSANVKPDGGVYPNTGSNVWFDLSTISFPATGWVGIGPFGPPVWGISSSGLIRIDYIAGLSPSTKYDVVFEVE